MVARPAQDFREVVVAHSAESSRTAPSTETRSSIVVLRIPAQSPKFKPVGSVTRSSVGPRSRSNFGPIRINELRLREEAFLGEGHIRDREVIFRRKDGQIRTSLGSAELIEVNGEMCALSVIADITERKLAEEAISGFGRRLIEAQETERARIARELHDDINQRLAMVAVSLKMIKQELPNPEQKTSRHIEDACARVSDLEIDIQALSHRLHSSET